jgi:hypothetical protein
LYKERRGATKPTATGWPAGGSAGNGDPARTKADEALTKIQQQAAAAGAKR